MSRILVKHDLSGEERLVDFWISQKGNLCWKLDGFIFVKLKSGYTMMSLEDESLWVPSDVHTAAKVAEVAALSKPQYNTAPLTFI